MSAGHTFAEAQARQANAERVIRYLTGKPPTLLANIAEDNPRIGGGTKAGVLLDYMVRKGLVLRIPQPSSRRALYALPGYQAVTS